MGKALAFAMGVMLGGLMLGGPAMAQAPQSSGPGTYRGLGSGTPGGTFTTPEKVTPGAEDKQTVPGGGIPMGASTQGASDLPDGRGSGDNTGSSKSR